MQTCYLIHGIKTRDANRSSISFLKYALKGFTVKVLSYGYIPVLLAPITSVINWFVVRRFVKQLTPGNVLIGHSNGCTIAYKISNKLYTKGLVLINPALDADVKFDPFISFIHIYWSRNDKVTWLSKFVPFSDWGSMGSVGYKGSDPRVKQFEMDINHTDIGEAEIAAVWGPFIVSNLNAEFKD